MGLTGEAKKKYQKDYMAKKRSNKTEGSNKKGLTKKGSNMVGLTGRGDPNDWSDPRNYSAVYLACLDKQGGKLTEASKVAMKGNIHPWPDRIPRSYLPSRVEDKPTGGLRDKLKDPGWRKKLGKICIALKHHGHSDDVTFGIYGPSFTEIGDALDETAALN